MSAIGGSAGASVQQQVHAARRYERSDGVVVDDTPAARGMLAGIGVAAVVAGVSGLVLSKTGIPAALGMQLVGRSLGQLGLAGAVTGAGLLGASFLIKPKVDHYLEKPTSNRETAFAHAAKYDDDVAIHKRSDGTYGLLDVGKFNIDDGWPSKVDLGSKPIVFEGFTSRDNDYYVRGAGGSWIHKGVIGGPTVKLDQLSGTQSRDLERLTGAQIGTDADHKALLVGRHVGAKRGYSSFAQAEKDLFERYGKDAVVLKLKDAYHGFAVRGASPGVEVHARGTQITPTSAVRFVAGANALSLTAPGRAVDVKGLPQTSLVHLHAADAKQLKDRRVGTTAAGKIVRVGNRVGDRQGYNSRDLAGISASLMRGNEHVLLKLGSHWFVFTPTDSVAKIESLLGPSNRIALQRGSKLYGADSANGGLRVLEDYTPDPEPYYPDPDPYEPDPDPEPYHPAPDPEPEPYHPPAPEPEPYHPPAPEPEPYHPPAPDPEPYHPPAPEPEPYHPPAPDPEPYYPPSDSGSSGGSGSSSGGSSGDNSNGDF